MKIIAKTLSSLESLGFTNPTNSIELECCSCFENEAYSFQLFYMAEGDAQAAYTIDYEIITSLKNSFTVREVSNVPVMRPCYEKRDDWYLSDKPGMFPDVLSKVNGNSIRALNGVWKSLWITLNEDLANLPAGDFSVTIRLFEHGNKSNYIDKILNIKILPALLPPQKVSATNWIHCDCICDAENCRPFSAKFWSFLKKYLTLAAKNGQTMALVPSFTPPLDTEIGEERKTIQLVKVTKTDEKYSFDFSLFRKYIEVCQESGISEFEHSHFFTQWGARHAPKIIATVDGKEKQIFGWETDSSSKEYFGFLHTYITELKKLIKELNLEKAFLFHVSDEPNEKAIEKYKIVSDFIHKELKGFRIGDALSNFDYYKKGIVSLPIVRTDSIIPFIETGTEIWAYFTGEQCFDYSSNRLISMPAARNRILGTQLFYYGIKGFLQWGLNYWYIFRSRHFFNPFISPDAEQYFTGGTSFIVYPGVIPSIRLMLFRDAMQDIRALELLASLIGKSKVNEFIDNYWENFGFSGIKISADSFLKFREKINFEIEKNLSIQ